MHVPITAFYASLLALCYLYLSGLVISIRRRERISLGDGGNEDLKRVTRAHANFAEYVPITLLLVVCLEINGSYSWAIHSCASMLLFGRILHAYGLRKHEGASWQRFAGMIFTFLSLLAAACTNLYLIHYMVTG